MPVIYVTKGTCRNEVKFLNNVLIANEYHPKDVNQIISTCENQKGDKSSTLSKLLLLLYWRNIIVAKQMRKTTQKMQ